MSDKGVRANLLQRHFGSAGTGSDLTHQARAAERRAALREQREAVTKLTEMQKTKPLKPPGRKPREAR